MKYYFCAELFDENLCYSLKAILDEMEEQDVESVFIIEAVRNTGQGFFYCKKYHEVGMTIYSNCGKFCEYYKPRNGKNGICQHWGYTYEEGEKKYLLCRTGLLKQININQ